LVVSIECHPEKKKTGEHKKKEGELIDVLIKDTGDYGMREINNKRWEKHTRVTTLTV
jgi:hypothetical protein